MIAFLLNPRYKLIAHFVQLTLVTAVMAIAGTRILRKGGQIRRNDTMGLDMGTKSIVIISYQLGTEHIQALAKWASLKANTILNSLEILFWAAVAFMGIQSNTQSCVGLSCTLGWVVVVISIILSILAAPVAHICFIEFRMARKYKQSPTDSVQSSSELGHL